MKLVSLISLALSLAVSSASRTLRSGNDSNEKVLAKLFVAPTAKVEFLKIDDNVAMVAMADTEEDTTLLKIVMEAVTKNDDEQMHKDPVKLYKKIAEFAREGGEDKITKQKAAVGGKEGMQEDPGVPGPLVEAAEALKRHESGLEEVEEDLVMVEQVVASDEDGRRLKYGYCEAWRRVSGDAKVHRYSNSIVGEMAVRYGDTVHLSLEQKLCSRCQWKSIISRHGSYTMLEGFVPSYTWLRVRTSYGSRDIYDLRVCW